MTIDPQIAVAIVVPAVVGLVWMVRLEGRINLAEARHVDIIKTLDKMDEKLDRLMGEP